MSKGSNRNKRNWKELYNRNLWYVILPSSPCCPHASKTSESDSSPGGPFILLAPGCHWRQLSDGSAQEERHFALLYLIDLRTYRGRKFYSGSIIHKKASRDLSDFEGRRVTYWKDSDKITQKIGLHVNGLLPTLSQQCCAQNILLSSKDFRQAILTDS